MSSSTIECRCVSRWLLHIKEEASDRSLSTSSTTSAWVFHLGPRSASHDSTDTTRHDSTTYKCTTTLPGTDMEVENGPLEDHFPLQTGGAIRFHVSSRERQYHSIPSCLGQKLPDRSAVQLAPRHRHRRRRTLLTELRGREERRAVAAVAWSTGAGSDPGGRPVGFVLRKLAWDP